MVERDPKSGFEGSYSSLLKTRIGDRFRFLAYQDDKFAINVQPIVGIESETVDTTTISNNSTGLWVYGYIGKYIGFSLDLRNAKINPVKGFDYANLNGGGQGRIGYVKDNVYNYNIFNGYITGKWNWGSISFGKSPISIGYGKFGKIILSEKAPSFPNIRIDVKPVSWLSFSYTHGWLNSLIIDSLSLRQTILPAHPEYNFRQKYYAEHLINWRAFKGFNFTIGESVIYSDQIKPAYLIPLSLFSAVNHYLGESNFADNIANAQIFLQFSSRNHIPKTHLYFTFFIDEMSTKGIGIDPLRNQTAYQTGLSVADFIIPNLTFDIEYSRIRPFVYQHFLPVQTFTQNGYTLGHWIGANADLFSTNINYRIKRGLTIDAYLQLFQKGSLGTSFQQTLPGDYPFLWGNLQTNFTVGVKAQYEIMHDFFLSFQISSLSQNGYNKRTFDSINLGFKYGF